MIATALNLVKARWAEITLLVLGMITISSIYPLPDSPSSLEYDKTYHVIAYLFLMFPVALHRPKYWSLIGVCFFFWSGTIELVQPYFDRHGEWLDLAANTGGILLACLVAHLLRPVIKEV